VAQWDEWWHLDHINDTETLQLMEVADYYRVPLSWVREHCTPHDVRVFCDYVEIKDKRMEEEKREARSEAGG